jgi:hypothetical protein
MNFLRDLYSNLKQKLKGAFNHNAKHEEKPQAKKSQPVKEAEENLTGYSKLTAWCASFNRRHGYIVPEKSPESQYRKLFSGHEACS